MPGLLFSRNGRHACKVMLGGVVASFLMGGCSDPEPRVYRVERVEHPTQGMAMSASGGDLAGTPDHLPPHRWEAPAEWQAQPLSSFRIGSYRPQGEHHDHVDISITTFSGPGGDDLANVNRWRDQIGLPHLSREQLRQDRQETPSGVGPLALYDYKGEASGDDSPFRIVAAIYRDEAHNVSWFFRISGPDAAVETEMTRFRQLVASFITGTASQPQVSASPATPPPAAPIPPAPVVPDITVPGTPALQWTAPADWREGSIPSGQVAFYRTIATVDEGGVQTVIAHAAQTTVSLLELVNRWRIELQLEPLTADNLETHGSRMTINGFPMFIVDIEKADTESAPRILGSIFPHGDQLWSVRTEGQSAAVQSHLQNFITFLSSLRARP